MVDRSTDSYLSFSVSDDFDDDCLSAHSRASENWHTAALAEISVDENAWTGVSGAESYFIDIREILVGQRFATGSSGRLYHGRYRDMEVAIKVIRQPYSEAERVRLNDEFVKETRFLSSISHPNIVKLVGACHKDNSKWCMVTEFLSGGTLKKFLQSRLAEPLPWNMVFDLALDISSAMEYLHDKGIIHRDLKSENIVFDNKGNLKLTDFGISREASKRGDMTAEMGTYRWMAPEMIEHESYNEKVDVYSFGILLWEIVTREQPYGGMTPVQVAFAVVSKNTRPLVPEMTLGVIGELLEKCWRRNHKDRPSFKDIVNILTNAKRDYTFNPLMESFANFKSKEASGKSSFRTSDKSDSQSKCCIIL